MIYYSKTNPNKTEISRSINSESTYILPTDRPTDDNHHHYRVVLLRTSRIHYPQRMYGRSRPYIIER